MCSQSISPVTGAARGDAVLAAPPGPTTSSRRSGPCSTVPPDVVMGHSLGGLVASLVADRLAPRAAIYIDPAFAFPKGSEVGLQDVLRGRTAPEAVGAACG